MPKFKGTFGCDVCGQKNIHEDVDYDDDIFAELTNRIAFDFCLPFADVHTMLRALYPTWDGRDPKFFLEMIAPVKEVWEHGMPFDMLRGISHWVETHRGKLTITPKE